MDKFIKEITTAAGTITGDAVQVIDVTDSADYIDSGEVRIQDQNAALQGRLAVGQNISVAIGMAEAGTAATETIFSGTISEVTDEDLIILKMEGAGKALDTRRFKKTYHDIDAQRVLKDIMAASGMPGTLGALTVNPRRHTYICPNGTIINELNQAIAAFGLDLFAFVTRDGRLVVDKPGSQLRETAVEFKTGEFSNFENNTITTFADPEIKVFDKIKILAYYYQVTSHRILINGRNTASILTAEKT